MAVVGIGIGAVNAAVDGRSLEELVFGVTACDPAVYLIVAATLTLVVLVASLVPARGAARVDPLIALRGR
jgi:ABC-type antimicrobial peptide transport system permease subunit